MHTITRQAFQAAFRKVRTAYQGVEQIKAVRIDSDFVQIATRPANGMLFAHDGADRAALDIFGARHLPAARSLAERLANHKSIKNGEWDEADDGYLADD